MKEIYFQVVGPDINSIQKFIEKVSHERFSVLNDFKITLEKEFDNDAYKNYFILPNNLELDHLEKEEWMKFYHDNNDLVWVSEF